MHDRDKSAGHMTNWAARLFTRAIDCRLKQIGVSSGMLPVFLALGRGARLSQKALAVAAAIEQPTMAVILSRMEREGLIDRWPDPADRRSQLIALTPAAIIMADQIEEAVMDVNGIALQYIEEADRVTFFYLLKAVVLSLEKSLDGQSRQGKIRPGASYHRRS